VLRLRDLPPSVDVPLSALSIKQIHVSLNQRNSKKQGDVGLGAAIAWYTALGHTVSIPLTDSQDYDLVVDTGDGLKTVQVKTTRYKDKRANGQFCVHLGISGGNLSGKFTRRTFDTFKVDYLFILTSDKSVYIIPSNRISSKYLLHLNSKYASFKQA
jgi:hypothetical protein